jgi:flavin reductase (DIM6/NTAB) family NADH-FMN oxidoreductase RutF
MSDETKPIAVGHIPSGLFIVCAHDKENNSTDGFLASWVQQISFAPLLISLCVKPGRPAYDHIANGGVFSINVIGDHEKNYMKHFWKGYDPEKGPFSEIPHKLSKEGAVIIDQAKSAIICKMISSTRPGDHEVIVAEVLNSMINNQDALPVVHIRKSGLEY